MNERDRHPFGACRPVRLPGAIGKTRQRLCGKRGHVLMQRSKPVGVIGRKRGVIKAYQMKITRRGFALPPHAVKKTAGELGVGAEYAVE